MAAVAAALLLALMFALNWYGPGAIARGVSSSSSVNGWDGLLHLHWLILATGLAGLGVAAWSAATSDDTALSRSRLPDAGLLLLALANVLWLGYRVLISVPPAEKWPAYAGLLCALGVLLGAGVSMLAPPRDLHPPAEEPEPGGATSAPAR